MGNLVSPGIQVIEIDNTTTVPAVSTTTGALAGIFNWGPANTRVLVSSEPVLAQTFGSPNSNNAETFFTGANFLAYGNALQTVRVIDGHTTACVNTGSIPANTAILNVDDYNNKTISANLMYLAKYPGALGNSLEISVCDSVNAYSMIFNAGTLSAGNGVGNTSVTGFTLAVNNGSNVATITVTANAAGAANSTTTNLLTGLLANGDILSIGNTTIGTQNMQITGWTANTTELSNSGVYTSTSTINLGAYFNLPANFSGIAVTRYWQYYNRVNGAPSPTYWMNVLGLTVVDAVHVVVVDNLGLFTGSPNQILEVFSNLSRATDAQSDLGQTNYYKTILNNNSNYVWYGQDRAGAASNTAATLVNSTNNKALTQAFVGAVDGNSEGNCSLTALVNGYNLFKSKVDVDISLLMQGKARGLSAETNPSSNALNYSVLANYILGNIAQTRKDLLTLISPAKVDVVMPNNNDATDNCVAFFNNVNDDTSYGAMDTGYKYQFDKYSDVYRWIPLNGDIAGLCAYTDQVAFPWYSPAGFNRGNIKNVVRLAFNPTQAQRDILYQSYINPVVTFPGQGTVLYGDKTMLGRPSAFDRINVRRLFITIEKAIQIASNSLLFEFNNTFTRATFVNFITPYLRTIQGQQGITQFQVVCDDTNNTPQIIDSNQFIGDIYIWPARSINFITLNFIAMNDGVTFSEVVGTSK